MIILKSPQEIEEMRVAGAMVAACHREVAKLIKPGITTRQIDQFVENWIRSRNAIPTTIGYKGYRYATCAAVNDVIAHGFPNDVPLQDGDLVTIDIVISYGGWVGDSGWTYAVGTLSAEAEKLMKVTKESLYLGIKQARAGNRIGDVTHAVQSHAEKNGFSVVRDLLAHGIGRSLHEEPNFAHIGKPGKGFRLKEGMVFTIEPMINVGTPYMLIDADGWTARTADGSLSAQYEHTIAITDGDPIILTEQ